MLEVIMKVEKTQVPSGRFLFNTDFHLIKMMVGFDSLKWKEEPFKLQSGIESNVYFSLRDDLTDNPFYEWAIGRRIAELIRGYYYGPEKIGETTKQPCLIGVPTAGTSLAQSASMVSYRDKIYIFGEVMCHRVMREERKQHGANFSWVNGESNYEKHAYWLVENVITSGSSVIKAAERLEESGYNIGEMAAFIFLDRQQAGLEKVKAIGFKEVVVAYNLLDVSFALGELGLWPKERVKAVEDEIKTHQFIPSKIS